MAQILLVNRCFPNRRGGTRKSTAALQLGEALVVTFLVRLARPDAPAVTSERPTPDHIVFAYDYTGAFEAGE